MSIAGLQPYCTKDILRRTVGLGRRAATKNPPGFSSGRDDGAMCTTTCGRLRLDSSLDGARRVCAGARRRSLNTMACCSHGIKIRKQQAEDEFENQPLPKDHNHGSAAHVCETGRCVRFVGTGWLGGSD